MSFQRKLLFSQLSACLTSANGTGVRHDTDRGPYWFTDNGSPILGIAHMDYAMYAKPQRLNNTTVRCPQLDNRLGWWTIAHLLPALGVTTDLLLTVGEEIGRSSGARFVPPKKYNWMYQFDRAGETAVMYMYATTEWHNRLWDHGFIPSNGSFSDISFMTHMGITGFNFGNGLVNAHRKSCHVDLKVTLAQAKKFRQFYTAFKDTPTTWRPNERQLDHDRYPGNGYNLELWDGDDPLQQDLDFLQDLSTARKWTKVSNYWKSRRFHTSD